MVDDVLIGKLNDEISEERSIESKTYPSSNIGMYNIYFENFK